MRTSCTLSILILTIAFSVVGQAIPSISSTAKALSQETRFQDGPNCFNTSLNVLGYSELKAYSHQSELEYYLKYHCQQDSFKMSPLKAETLLTYADDSGNIAHSAVALNSTTIIEKNSLYGSKHPEVYGDPEPGKYLVHAITESVFFKKLLSHQGSGHAYLCQPKQTVLAVTKELQKDEGTGKIYELLSYISRLTEIKDRKSLDKKLNNDLLKKYASLNIQEHLTYISGNQQLDSYKLGLIESAAYQWNLLNCSDAYEKYDDCYAPEVQTSINTLEALYRSIYTYRNYVKSQYQYK